MIINALNGVFSQVFSLIYILNEKKIEHPLTELMKKNWTSVELIFRFNHDKFRNLKRRMTCLWMSYFWKKGTWFRCSNRLFVYQYTFISFVFSKLFSVFYSHPREAAHNSCYLNYQISRGIPIIFHNLSGYDIFIKELVTSTVLPGNVLVIPLSNERYISFTKHIPKSAAAPGKKPNPKDHISFKFLDSFRFMESSLDKLASFLTYLPLVTKEFQKDNYAANQTNLLKTKGVFPYDHISSLDSLEETSLPTQDKFYNSLNDSQISMEDHDYATQVWNKLWIQTLGQYSDVYLKTDVLLLANVFEAYRAADLKTYGSDPCHYYTTLGAYFACFLVLFTYSINSEVE